MNKYISQGDDAEIIMVFTDANGNDVDISAWDFFYTVKRKPNDDDTDALLSVDPAGVTLTGSPTVNTATIPLESVYTTAIPVDSYPHDVKVIKADGAGARNTIMKGSLIVEEHVTKRVT